MSLVQRLEVLTSSQQRDVERLAAQMQRRLNEITLAPTSARRKEAGEWILRVAAEIYAWSR